eukprot:scaffold17876_cov132-Isochrysis_galbana.AAC.5
MSPSGRRPCDLATPVARIAIQPNIACTRRTGWGFRTRRGDGATGRARALAPGGAAGVQAQLLTWRPFQRSAFTDGPKPYLAIHGFSASYVFMACSKIDAVTTDARACTGATIARIGGTKDSEKDEIASIVTGTITASHRSNLGSGPRRGNGPVYLVHGLRGREAGGAVSPPV